MDPNKETAETWNAIASLYQEKFMNLPLYNDSYDDICRVIQQPNAKLLEIGCGPGNITRYLLKQRPDFDILGIDIAPNMIELARANNPTAQFKVMDTRHINQLNTLFDGIIGGFCLPYVSQVEADELIATAHRMLHPNGLLYLSFVEGDPEQSGFKSGGGGRVFFQYHLLSHLQAQLNRVHFDAIKVMKVKYPTSETTFDVHTIITAQKRAET